MYHVSQYPLILPYPLHSPPPLLLPLLLILLSPPRFLDSSDQCLLYIDEFCNLLSAAIQNRPKVASLHFMLAQGLEERFFAYDTLRKPLSIQAQVVYCETSTVYWDFLISFKKLNSFILEYPFEYICKLYNTYNIL